LRNSIAILLAAASLLSGIANAQAAPTEAQQQAIRSSCQSDYRTYCASVPTGGSAALQCLEKNISSLSAACQQAVNAATGGGSASTSGESGGSAVSGGSATTSGASAGGTAANPQTNSAGQPKPVIIVLEPVQELAVMREACGSDYRTFCAGVRIIGGGALSCLVSHASALSPSCKGMLGKLGQRF
jgi:Cysteine rich repeat